MIWSELLAERAAYITYGDETQVVVRWSVKDGVQRRERPDI